MADRYDAVPTVAPNGPTGQMISTHYDPSMFGGQVAQAIGQAGAQAQDLGMQFIQRQNAINQLNATTAASKDLGQLDSQFRQLSGENAQNALPQYQQGVEAIRSKHAGSLQGAAQVGFLHEFAGLADRTMTNMGIHAGTQAKEAHIQAMQGAINEEQSSLVRSAATTGQMPDFSGLINRAALLAHEQGMDKPAADALVQKVTGDAVRNMVITSIGSADPNSYNRSGQASQIFQQAMKMNVPGTDLPLMGAQHVGEITQQLQNVKWTDDNRKFAAEQKAMAEQTRADNQALVAATASIRDVITANKAGISVPPGALPSRDQLTALARTNPAAASGLIDTIDELHASNDAVAKMKGATPQQMADMIADMRSQKPDSPAAAASLARQVSAMQTMAANLYKLRQDDPHGAVAQYSPETAQASDAALQASFKDPAQVGTFVQAATHLLATQQTLGVDHAAQSVLSPETAKNMVGQLNSGQLSFQQLQRSTGPMFGQILKDLSNQGGMSPELVVAGYLPPAAADNLRQAITNNESRKKIEDVYGKEKGGDLVNGQLSKVASSAFNGDLSAYAKSLANSGVPQDQITAIPSAIQKLTLANIANGNGEKSAQMAIDSFMGNFTRLDGGTYVPKQYAESAQRNMDNIVKAVGLAPRDLVIPSGYDQRTYATQIKSQGQWIHAMGQDAMILVGPDGKAVMNAKTGQPVGFNFGQTVPQITIPGRGAAPTNVTVPTLGSNQ